MTILADKIVRGRKPHQCDYCLRAIPVGERHRHVTGVWDDGIQSQRECAHCSALFAAIYRREPEMMYEEYWDVGEYVREHSPFEGPAPLLRAWEARWADVTVEQVTELCQAAWGKS